MQVLGRKYVPAQIGAAVVHLASWEALVNVSTETKRPIVRFANCRYFENALVEVREGGTHKKGFCFADGVIYSYTEKLSSNAPANGPSSDPF